MTYAEFSLVLYSAPTGFAPMRVRHPRRIEHNYMIVINIQGYFRNIPDGMWQFATEVVFCNAAAGFLPSQSIQHRLQTRGGPPSFRSVGDGTTNPKKADVRKPATPPTGNPGPYVVSIIPVPEYLSRERWFPADRNCVSGVPVAAIRYPTAELLRLAAAGPAWLFHCPFLC